MTNRERNEVLFKAICKVICEGMKRNKENSVYHVPVTHKSVIQQAWDMNIKMGRTYQQHAEYITKFIAVMNSKELLTTVEYADRKYLGNKRIELEITKAGCDKVREMKRQEKINEAEFHGIATCEVCGEAPADSGLHGYCADCAERELDEHNGAFDIVESPAGIIGFTDGVE